MKSCIWVHMNKKVIFPIKERNSRQMNQVDHIEEKTGVDSKEVVPMLIQVLD